MLAIRRRAIYLAGLAWAGCGHFDIIGPSNTAPADAALIDAAPRRLAYVGPFVARDAHMVETDTFTEPVHAAGNAIVIQTSCGTTSPVSVTLTAPGWQFTPLIPPGQADPSNPITVSNVSDERSATFFAIAPADGDVTVTVGWGATCTSGMNHIGDEFTATGPSGATITFDNFEQIDGMGDCVHKITTPHDGDAVWAACDSDRQVVATGPGFMKGADDDSGDWSEYRLSDDPAGTVESILFTNTAPDVGYVLSMVTLTVQ